VGEKGKFTDSGRVKGQISQILNGILLHPDQLEKFRERARKRGWDVGFENGTAYVWTEDGMEHSRSTYQPGLPTIRLIMQKVLDNPGQIAKIQEKERKRGLEVWLDDDGAHVRTPNGQVYHQKRIVKSRWKKSKKKVKQSDDIAQEQSVEGAVSASVERGRKGGEGTMSKKTRGQDESGEDLRKLALLSKEQKPVQSVQSVLYPEIEQDIRYIKQGLRTLAEALGRAQQDHQRLETQLGGRIHRVEDALVNLSQADISKLRDEIQALQGRLPEGFCDTHARMCQVLGLTEGQSGQHVHTSIGEALDCPNCGPRVQKKVLDSLQGRNTDELPEEVKTPLWRLLDSYIAQAAERREGSGQDGTKGSDQGVSQTAPAAGGGGTGAGTGGGIGGSGVVQGPPADSGKQQAGTGGVGGGGTVRDAGTSVAPGTSAPAVGGTPAGEDGKSIGAGEGTATGTDAEDIRGVFRFFGR